MKQEIKIEYVSTVKLEPYAKNARTHSEVQVGQIANSIQAFGFNNPVLLDAEFGIVAGHGRVMAAKQLGIDLVPCIRLGHLSERQKRAYILADNKIALNAGWDFDLLAEEVSYLVEVDADIEALGFSEQEIDAMLKDDVGIMPDEKLAIPVKAHERKVAPDQKPKNETVPPSVLRQIGLLVMAHPSGVSGHLAKMIVALCPEFKININAEEE